MTIVRLMNRLSERGEFIDELVYAGEPIIRCATEDSGRNPRPVRLNGSELLSSAFQEHASLLAFRGFVQEERDLRFEWLSILTCSANQLVVLVLFPVHQFRFLTHAAPGSSGCRMGVMLRRIYSHGRLASGVIREWAAIAIGS